MKKLTKVVAFVGLGLALFVGVLALPSSSPALAVCDATCVDCATKVLCVANPECVWYFDDCVLTPDVPAELVTQVGVVKTGIFGMIIDNLGEILYVFGAILGITLGVKLFRRIAR